MSPCETLSRRTSLTRDRLEAQGDLVTHARWVQDLLALARATVNHEKVEVHGRVGRHCVHNARPPRARDQTLRTVRESGGNDEPPPAFLFHAERARIRAGGNTVRRRAQRPLEDSYTRALKNEESAGGPRRKPPVHTCARLTWHSKEVIQFKRHGLSTPHLEVAEDLIANFWLWPDALYNVNDAHAV